MHETFDLILFYLKKITLVQPATFVSLGCFADTKNAKKHPRALPILYANFRSSIDWYDLSKTVQACAEEAKEKR